MTDTTVPQVEVVKPKRTRRPMTQDRKDAHLTAKTILLEFFKTAPEKQAAWTALYPEKQVRVLSNLLLDYLPGYLTFGASWTAEQVVAAETLLTAAARDLKAFRKTAKLAK